MASNQMKDTVKEWMSIDLEMQRLNKEIRTLRERKKGLTNNLVEIMNANQIDSFQTSSGRLVHSSRNTRAPLSKKHLLESLMKYFKGDEEMASELSKLIMESREIRTVETIQKKK
tara:strand:+ start:251 stop:595 length:345 start_codon:yes stop_codon:yes gene_type:complete